MQTKQIPTEDLRIGDSVAFGTGLFRIVAIEPYVGALSDVMFGRAVAEGGDWSISLERGGLIEIAGTWVCDPEFDEA